MARGEYYMDDAPISDDGVFSTEGMKGVNVNDNPPEPKWNPNPVINIRGRTFQDQKGKVNLNYGEYFEDESKYDDEIADLSRLERGYTVNQLRGEVQSGIAQLGAGLAKAGVLAGTTLAEGIVGTIYSIGAAAKQGRWSALFDNDFTNLTQRINDWSEDLFKIYETKEEENSPWYEKFYKASYIGDNVLKNMGFMVGAAWSGRIGVAGLSKLAGLNKIRNSFKGAANISGQEFRTIQEAVAAVNKGEDIYLNGLKITDQFLKSSKTLKNALPVQKLTGSFLGALGEARFEASANSRDWFELKKQQLDDAYKQVEQGELDALYNEAPHLFTYQKGIDGSLVLTPNENALAIAKGRAQQKFDYEGGLAKITEDRLKMGNADFLMNIPLLTVSDLWQFGKFYAGGYNTARKTANIVKKITDGKVSYAAPQRGWAKKGAKILQKGIAEGPFEEMGQSSISTAAGYKYASELNDFYGAKIDPEAEQETQGWIKSTAKALLDTYGDVDNWGEAFVGGISGMLGVPSIQRIKSREGKLQSPITFKGGAAEDIREISEQNQREQEIVNALNARVQSPEFLNYYQGMIRHNKYQRDMDRAVEGGDNFEFKNAEHSQFISDINMFEKAGRLNDLYDIIEEAENIKPEDIEQIRELTTDPQSGKAVYENAKPEDIISDIKKRASKARDWVDRYREISEALQTRAGTERSSDELDELTWMMTKIEDWQGRFDELHSNVKESLKSVLLEKGDLYLDSEKTDKVSDLMNLSSSELLAKLASNPEALSLLDQVNQVSKNSYAGNDLLADVTDLARISKARNEFIHKYNDYINNPGKLAKVMADDEEAALKATEEGNTKDLRERIESAQNMDELNEILNNETDEEATNKVLEKLREEGNPLIQQKDEYDSLVDDIQTNLDEITPDDETLADANALLDELISRGGNLEDLTNSIIEGNFDAETLQDEDRLVKAAYVIQDSLARALQAKKLKESIGEIELPTDEDMDDEDSLVPTTRPYEPPVGDITPEELREGNKGYIPNAQGEFLVPAISEFHIDAQREGDFRPFPIVELEKSGRDYTTIYGELEERGAFDYVNNGELLEGDEIKFMIDPAFEAKVENNPVFTKPTIFMVKEVDGRNQVVGVLPVAAKYKGTTELQSRVIEGYNKSNKTEQYVAPDTTKVSKIMVGRVPSGDEMRPLSEIPGVGTKPLFGIMKGGRIVTGNNDVEIEQPQDVTDKDGRLYLMIPAPNGKSRPSFVRVKHFNNKEYDLSDPKNISTPLYDNLSTGLNAVASAKSQAELDEAVAILSETVYTGDLFFDLVGGDKGTFIRITKVYRDERGNYIYETVDGEQVLKKSKPEFIKLEEALPFASLDTSGRTMAAEAPAERTIENIQAELTKKLMKFNQPFQVSVNKINKGSYNEYLINSGVLTSDITEARYRGSFFMADPFEPDGTTRRANIPPSPKPSTGKKAENSVGGKETVLKGTRVTLGNEEYSVDNDIIYDKNGQVIKPENSDIIKAIAYVERTYGDSKNGVNMIDGVVLIGNRAFDSNTNTFLEDKAAKDFKDSLKPKPIEKPKPQRSRERQISVHKDRDLNIIVNGETYKYLGRNDYRDSQGAVVDLKTAKALQLIAMSRRWYGPGLNNEEMLDGILYNEEDGEVIAVDTFTGKLLTGKAKDDFVRAFNERKSKGRVIPDFVNVGKGYLNVAEDTFTDSDGNPIEISKDLVTESTTYGDVTFSPYEVARATGYGIAMFGGFTKEGPPGMYAWTYMYEPKRAFRKDSSGALFLKPMASKSYSENIREAAKGRPIPTIESTKRQLKENPYPQFTYELESESSESDKNNEPAPGASPVNNENKEGANNTSTQESGKEAELAERLNKINEAQARVDMGNSTRDKYMILEDDNQYHEYKNIDTVLGPNWIEKPETSEKLKGIEAELFNRSETPEEFNKYLKSLQAIYSIDLSSFEGKTDSNSRDEIVGVMRDTLNNTNSQRAIKAKTAIDGIIDSFFNDPTKAVERPENLSEESYNGLISSLTRIKDQLDSKGDTVVGTNMVVYHTFPDGAKIAGTVDMVLMDKEGNFKFLNIKSSRYSFHDFVGNNGKKMNFFEGKSRFQNMSSREYFTDQMSMAKNIFESQFGMPVSSMGILPFVMDYSKDDNTTVDKLVMEKGIPLKYNPSVKIPVVSQPEKTSTEEPVFNSILETRSPIDMTEDVSKMEGSKVGYYINSDGNLVKGNLVLGGTIEGSKVYFVRELTDQVSMKKHFQDYTYKAVFENGKSLTVAKHVSLERKVPFESFMSLLNSNLEKVREAMSASTIISDFNSKMDSSIEKSVSKLNAAKGTIGKRRPKFRLANRTEKKMSIKEEFAWLKEVLPGLATKDRLKVQKGLITVAEKGAQAWGQYENGVITLSDIAAEGTLYHEAFHAVFDLMASPEERENVLREARERWGDLSEEGLEEKLAEEFRVYTMGVRVKSLGKRILDFFKTLWYKVSNWSKIKPYTYSFYQKINEGRFSEMSETALRAPKESMRFEELRRGVRSMLEAKGWTSEMWDKISDMEKKHAIKCASL